MLKIIDDFVWGVPLIVLILAVGIFLTIRLRGLQITKLPLAVRHIIANEKDGKDGEVSSFGALCTALSATIGTGNIVGVATAVVAGGPGALFWMWIAALFGTATSMRNAFWRSSTAWWKRMDMWSADRFTILRTVWAENSAGWDRSSHSSAWESACSASEPLRRSTELPVR